MPGFTGFAAAGGLVVACVLLAACSGEPRQDFEEHPPAPAIDAGTTPAPVTACGEAEDLPNGAKRDDAAHELTVACDGDAKGIVVTVLDDGLLRLRYGTDVATGGGSLVAIDRPAAKSALVAGRRGAAAVVCTNELELVIEPHRCTLLAKDVATGVVVLDDTGGGGFFRGAAGEPSAIGVVHAAEAGERFYGLGLHTATKAGQGLDMRGSLIDLRNTDAFDAAAGGFRPDAPSLYESIPFYVGLRGKTSYGLFTDNTHRLRFDLASSDASKVRATASGGAIDQYLVAGPSMRDVVRRYTLLTGRMPIPAPWALGFHQSRWEGPCDGAPAERPFCSASQIAAVAQGLRDRGVPADGLFLDIQHMNGFRSFTFDGARFADPESFLAQLGALGFHVSTIIDPGIKVDPGWDVYQAGLAGGHFLKAPGSSSPFEGEVWPGTAAFPDFSAAKTRTWWSGLVGTLASRGVSGAWIDMNEPASFTTGSVPDDVNADGDGHATTMAEVHNAYGYLEAKATYEGMKSARPSERPFVLSRAAFAGQQKYSAVWTGDAPSTWTTLGMTLPQLLHLGMSGIAFAGSDVGGYSGRAESTAELFSRWMALGAVSPFFRAHAEKDARRQEPWAFGTETLDATRSLVSFRYELMPYLYSVFDESSRTGAPVLRPLVFEFQDDESTHAVADEAMLGPSLLVAPVLVGAQTSRAVLLPKGRWFDLRSGAVFEGGKTVTVAATPDALPKDALPVFAREGAIVPRAEASANVAAAKGGVLFVDAFPGAAKSTFTLREDDGTTSAAVSRLTFATSRSESSVRFEASAREGSHVAAHSGIVVRIRRVDHDVTSVKVDGVALSRASGAAPLAAGTFMWDANDRAVVVSLPSKVPFALDVAVDAKLEPDGDVDVPLRVKLPAGTSAATAISVASSRAGWTHAPLMRTGDEATGTLRIPRGGYASFKISRGGWPTVEKGEGCVEIDNRRAFGAATRAVVVTVTAWADSCSP
ncbi:MAG: Alpha-glucosidase [Labilithrix sp.]|nr:Alpha-glucosidase [Labilithrix sp.]